MADKPIYLQQVEPSEICFLQEVLWWVAIRRLPIEILAGGEDMRLPFNDSYEADMHFGWLGDEECKKLGLPTDPRGRYDWSNGVLLSDAEEEIVKRAEQNAEGDDKAQEEARNEAVKFYPGTQ